MLQLFSNMSRRMRFALAIALTVLFINCGLIAVVHAVAKDFSSSEVVVTVVCGEMDENMLANYKFDDGTYLSDYDYTIEYVEFTENTAQRGSTLPVETFFDYVGWITRDEGISLSLQPKQSVRDNSTAWGSAWSVLVTNMQSDSRWSNEQVMYWQFLCHANFANDKDYWNLEPWRNASNYAQVVAGKCNP